MSGNTQSVQEGYEMINITGQKNMENDNTIIAKFKIKMTIILRKNEMIEDLRFKPIAIMKNFVSKLKGSLKESQRRSSNT